MVSVLQNNREALPDRESRWHAPATAAIVDETDSYTRSVAGTTVEAVRLGKGVGPNRVLGVAGEDVSITSSVIGFPMFTTSEIPDDHLIVTFIHETDGESRWCGTRLQPGGARVYGPGAEHFGANRPGLRFSFAAVGIRQLEDLSESLGVDLEIPSRGEALDFSPSATTMDFGCALTGYTGAVLQGHDLDGVRDSVLEQALMLLRPDGSGSPVAAGKAIDSRQIVRTCIDYAEACDRLPSISELCPVACVSERRLREAFVEEFDAPPSRFFRAWGLDLAHRRLVRSAPNHITVTDIAVGLGFNHLGRFAHHYRDLYGESPSATLQTIDLRLR